MKLLYFLPFLFISTLTAQNWSPVNLNDVYNYKTGQVDQITHSIWVDSVKVEGNDSVFYLNRILKGCDTCIVVWAPFCNPPYYLKNQPQFLQRKIIKTTPGIFQFINPDTFEIQVFARLNNSWIFDSVNQVMGTITFEDEISFLGITDSAKVVSLSDGGNILFSKNHGILSYFKPGNTHNYQLVGIEGSRKIADSITDALDIFDFEIGDVFQYEEYDFYSSGGNDRGYFAYERDSILSRKKVADTLIYEIERYSQKHELRINIPFPSGINVTTRNDVFEIKYLIKPGVIPNGYPNQWVIGGNDFFSPSMPTTPKLTWNNLFGKRIDIKEFGGEGGFCIPEKCYCIDTAQLSLPEDFLFSAERGWQIAQYVKGLGMINFEYYAPLGYESSRKLIGYKRNGKIFGTVYSNDFEPTSVLDSDILLPLRIFPNPTQGTLHFSLDENPTASTTIRAYSSKGKLIFSESISPGTQEFSIDLSENVPGIYLIRVEQDGKYHAQRIVLK